MSDDVWRRRDPDDGADEVTQAVPSTEGDKLSFGPNDTGPLPHWTEPPTGEVPRLDTLSEGYGSARSAADDTSVDADVDLWAGITDTDEPVWADAEEDPVPSSGGSALFDLDEPPPPPTRQPARISIGTDPTGDQPRSEPSRRPSRGGGSRSAPIPRRTPAPSEGGGAGRSGRNLPIAVAAGLGIAAIFLAALLWRPAAVVALIAIVMGLAAVEYYAKVTERTYRPATFAGLLACISLPLVAYWVGESALPLVVVFGFMATAVGFIGASDIESGPLPNSAVTLLGIVWIGLMGAYGALILGLSAGDAALANVGTDTFFLVAIGVVANDVGALFVGSGIGRSPLRPWISPNKSVEGLVGGTVFTFLAVILVGVQSDTWNGLGEWLLLALVISVLAPIGDLTESMFKRNLGVKDFGTLVPGHGGVLDRFDGFLFVLPGVYYLAITLQPWTSL
jgi:phosphatidate cytidylyltransferase